MACWDALNESLNTLPKIHPGNKLLHLTFLPILEMLYLMLSLIDEFVVI